MAGCAGYTRPRGIARCLGLNGEPAAQIDRDERHIAQKHEHAARIGRERGKTGAERGGHALIPIMRRHEAAGEAFERGGNGLVLSAGSDHQVLQAR